jgi:hypothetical protein
MTRFANVNCGNGEDIGLSCAYWDEEHYGIYRPEPIPDTQLDIHWDTATYDDEGFFTATVLVWGGDEIGWGTMCDDDYEGNEAAM